MNQNPSVDELASLYTLERVSGFGPVKFRALRDAGIEPQAAIENPEMLPFSGRVGEKLRRQISDLSKSECVSARQRAVDQLERTRVCSARILVHGSHGYPERVYASNNPISVLYVRGNPAIWDGRPSVALVGTRKPREPYAGGARSFAQAASKNGHVVVSGFALGVDTIGHTTALEAGGRTICVMPCGLDQVFPPENRDLWHQLLAYPGAVFVSEFAFGQRATSLTLRKRNKLIVSFSQSVLVAQSAANGGAMNAYRCALQQKKRAATFVGDGSQDTSGNEMIGKDRRTGAHSLELASDIAKYQSYFDRDSVPDP